MSKYLEFNTPASKEAKELASEYGFDNHGIYYPACGSVIANDPSNSALTSFCTYFFFSSSVP